jgi:hypothetical protein
MYFWNARIDKRHAHKFLLRHENIIVYLTPIVHDVYSPSYSPTLPVCSTSSYFMIPPTLLHIILFHELNIDDSLINRLNVMGVFTQISNTHKRQGGYGWYFIE